MTRFSINTFSNRNIFLTQNKFSNLLNCNTPSLSGWWDAVMFFSRSFGFSLWNHLFKNIFTISSKSIIHCHEFSHIQTRNPSVLKNVCGNIQFAVSGSRCFFGKSKLIKSGRESGACYGWWVMMMMANVNVISTRFAMRGSNTNHGICNAILCQCIAIVAAICCLHTCLLHCYAVLADGCCCYCFAMLLLWFFYNY